MKEVLICAHKMHCGGTEKALLSFLANVDFRRYDVTLLLEKIEGEWLDKLPKEVKLKELIPLRKKDYVYLLDLCPYKSSLGKKWFKFRTWLHAFMRSHLKRTYESYYRKVLKKIEREEKGYDYALDFFGYGYFLTGYVAEKVNARKKATWIHSLDLLGARHVKGFYANYDKVFCVSNAVKERFDAEYPEYADKSQVVYNEINYDEILRLAEEKVDDVEQNKNLIVSVGRLSHEKGFDFSVDVAKELRSRQVDFKWIIVGDGIEKDELSQRIKDYGLSDSVILLGRKDNPYPYMKKAKLYVQTSRLEGFGLTVAEAKTLGRVVVATDLPSFREQIIDGETGFIVELNSENFADKISELLREESDDYKRVERNLQIENTKKINNGKINIEKQFEN